VASASDDGTLRLWDVAKHRPILILDTPGTGGLVFASDNRELMAASSETGVQVFRATSAYDPAVITLLGGASEPVNTIDELSSRLRADVSLSPALRADALRVAAARNDDPAQLENDAWRIVQDGGKTPEEYQRALDHIQRAVALVPFERTYSDALGVALYRVGRYQDSLAALERGAALRGSPSAVHFAFRAMCNHRLGRPQDARADLARLRDEVRLWSAFSHADNAAWLAEVEALVAGRTPIRRP
jgi:tetratricopeptide (TPR) repeat protein